MLKDPRKIHGNPRLPSGGRSRRCFAIAAGLAMAFAGLMPARAHAEDVYPSRPIHIIVPFPAGGTADFLPRVVADKLRELWHQPVIIENRSGAGGNIGAGMVATSAPDGYTLLASPPGPIAINGALYETLAYRPTDLEPISILGTVPSVLDVRPGLPVKSVAELISYAKAHPGQVNFASQGNGSTSHLTAILFEKLTHVKMTHIPYRGTSPALVDLMGEKVDVFFDNLASSQKLNATGKIRIIAVGGARRSPSLPDVPTLSEAGVPGFQSVAWFGLMAPHQTPKPLIDKLNRAVAAILNDPEVKSKFNKVGVEPVGGDVASTAKYIDEERERWGAVIADAKIKIK